MNLVEQAFIELFPDKELVKYQFKLKYTDKFKPYNANVRYKRNFIQYVMQFNLSRKWEGISKEIQIGLIQGLMLKIFKERKRTINMDLYNSFMRNLHISIPKTNIQPILEESFNRVNEKYFLGMMEGPNLVWHNSIGKLGSYEYGSDTISISRILLQDMKVLDYVMYHEMLHKRYKFNSSNGRTCHHSREFREEEKKFENSQEIERKIKVICKKANKG